MQRIDTWIQETSLAHLGLTLSLSGVAKEEFLLTESIQFQEEMKWEERGIFTRLYFIVLCLDSQNWKYYKLIGFNMENWFVHLGSWFIIGVFQLHYKILWYLWSMHAQKIKFSFVIWSLLFGFHQPALKEMSLAFMFCLLI